MDTTRRSLLLRVKDAQDAEAWATFDGIYRPMLQRCALAEGLDAEAAEEVVQQCMASIHRHIQHFEYDPRKGRFKGWLRTMVANRVRNYVRDRRELQAGTRDFERPQQRETSPEETFDTLWMQEHLWYCLRQIREDVEEATFKAFQYYVIEQRPVDQVCAELGLTAENLYTIKWRLTEKVADRMRQLLGEAE